MSFWKDYESKSPKDGYRNEIWFMYFRKQENLDSIIQDLNSRGFVEVAIRYHLKIKGHRKRERDIVKSLAKAHSAGIVLELKTKGSSNYCFFGSPEPLINQGYPSAYYYQERNRRI